MVVSIATYAAAERSLLKMETSEAAAVCWFLVNVKLANLPSEM